MHLNRSIYSALTVLVATAAMAAFAQPAVKQLTIAPGKGVSFQMGRQTGMAVFAHEAGACGLTVTIAPGASQDSMTGMSGMPGNLVGAAANIAPTLKVQVIPGRPARLSIPDGQELVFNCGPDAKQMFLDMPSDFKYVDR